MQSNFWAGTKFGPAQNILGPVKGQGISEQVKDRLQQCFSGRKFKECLCLVQKYLFRVSNFNPS